MAVKSPLNPATIAPERKTSVQSAQNFISGGAPLGSSVFSAAANKIVGFQRGAASVSPRVPDLGSIISTLSSNILNNVQNSLQSINQNISNIVTQNLRSIGQDYQTRLKQIDDNTPNKILSNFLSLYQQAIEYIQFLGNRKNIKNLGDNLKELQRVFSETFEIAKIVRQTIVKIVKQLSNLPTASTGGGGLNLDIKVPGGPLKRSLPKGLGNFGRMALAGSAVAGAGALGGKVVSGMLDVGDQAVQPQMITGAEGLSGPTLDRFNAILEKFNDAIDSLSKRPRESSTRSFSSGGSGASPTPQEDESGSPGSSGAGASGPQGEATRSLLDAISFAEGTFHQPDQGYKTHFGFDRTEDLSKHPNIVKRSGGYASAAFGRYQFMPGTWEGVMGGAMTPERQDAGAVKLVMRRLNQSGIKVNNEQELESLLKSEGISPRIANALAPEWASFPTKSGGSYYGQPYKKLEKIQKFYTQRLQSQGVSGLTQRPPELSGTNKESTSTIKPTQPQVTAAPTQSSTQQQIAQTVAQPPPSQQKPQVNILPLNTGSPQPTQPRTQKAAPPPNMSSGKGVPLLPSTNHDNFLTLYSKMVYNIVDG